MAFGALARKFDLTSIVATDDSFRSDSIKQRTTFEQTFDTAGAEFLRERPSPSR